MFTYASPESAKADADLVNPVWSPIGTSMVSWVSAPHFYLKNTPLVLYVGLNIAVIERLETVMGTEFAGVDPTSSFTLPLPAIGPTAKVKEYLELMDNLSQALRGVVRSTNQEAAVATRLEEYVDFFASLYEQEQKELIASYAELIS